MEIENEGGGNVDFCRGRNWFLAVGDLRRLDDLDPANVRWHDDTLSRLAGAFIRPVRRDGLYGFVPLSTYLS